MITVLYGVTARKAVAKYNVCKQTYSAFKVDETGKYILFSNDFNCLPQGCRIPRRQVAVTTKFCTGVLNIRGYSVWK